MSKMRRNQQLIIPDAFDSTLVFCANSSTTTPRSPWRDSDDSYNMIGHFLRIIALECAGDCYANFPHFEIIKLFNQVNIWLLCGYSNKI